MAADQGGEGTFIPPNDEALQQFAIGFLCSGFWIRQVAKVAQNRAQRVVGHDPNLLKTRLSSISGALGANEYNFLGFFPNGPGASQFGMVSRFGCSRGL
jgi:hypothetical protein